MSDEQVSKMVSDYLARGGQITRIRGKRLPKQAWRMGCSLWTKGRKAITLKNSGIYLR